MKLTAIGVLLGRWWGTGLNSADAQSAV